ncbi:SET domain-containing protein 4 isoform X2 [Sphaerodactylus townsendi]|nr:SET domain-containing protein 4 isoform X2 [Sphaerodactylus townsendi]XP_048349488.1 SET domain-containing protein 4 isoform X2 [Sphaerodactylus townsendi]
MTTKALQAGQLIIALPEKCLLTTDTVLNSYLGEYIIKWRPPISPLTALCTFLIAEKYYHKKSVWQPYLDLLPETYTCPVYLEQQAVNLFPEPLRGKALEQKSLVEQQYTSSKSFFFSLQPLFPEHVESVFSYSAFQWAWCTINTRTVYMKHPQKECFSREPDNYALAPFLDLLNHSPTVQVKAAFNERTRCYEIKTLSHCAKYQEVFINYGPHDDQRLLLEYGFVAASNPHNCVHVDTDTLLKYLIPEDKQRHIKVSILQEYKLLDNLTFGWDGPSWRLLTALKLLCLDAHQFTSWKKVLLGDAISERNEKKSLDLAKKICTSLTEKTQRALHKISRLKQDNVDLVNQLSFLEALHTEDLNILLLSAENLLQMNCTTI